MAGKTAHHNSFQSRLAKARRDFPDASDLELIARVKASYRASTSEGKARQKAALIPQARTRERRAGRKPESIQKSAKAGRSFDGVTIIQFAENLLHVELRPAQRVILKSLYGLTLDANEAKLYATLTGGLDAQHGAGREAIEGVLCCGARSGKSLLFAIIALYECIARGDHWRRFLRPGELGYCIVVATRVSQAQEIVQGNAARLVQDSPELRGYLAGDPTLTRIEFTNRLCIQSMPCNATAGRGVPVFCLLLDEVAHFRVEGVNQDTVVYNSLAPRLAQFINAKVLLGSTPAAKQGLFHEWFTEGFTLPGRVTVQGSTLTINPQIDHAYLERMKLRDPDNYAREFDAQFAEQVAAYFKYDLVEAAMLLVGDQPAREEVAYHLAIDQSGLSGRDRFAAAIAHAEPSGLVEVDALRSWDARDADTVMAELAALGRAYRVTTALRDQYGAGWIASALAKHGLESELRPPLPSVYANTKGLLTAGRLRVPDNGELKSGLVNTVAFYGRNNALSIHHERTQAGHGDLADATCAAIWAASGRGSTDLAFSEADVDAAFSGNVKGFYRAA